MILCGEVEDSIVVVLNWNLEIDGEYEGFQRLALGPSLAKRMSYTVVRASEYVAELGTRFEPVHFGWHE